MLLAGSIGSCGPGMTRHVRTVPTASIQKTVDECVATSGKKACTKLCQEVFMGVDQCTVEQNGATTDVWYESETAAEPEPEHGCAPGRRPAGLGCPPRVSTIAAYFAWAAQLEAASVTAFARVHRTLVALGETALCDRVRAALADEIAHAQVMIALAHRYRARPTPPVIADVELSLVEHAIENAVEGCVNETVAAIHAALIATHAQDPQVRAAFAQVAIDETQHALLSYDLAAAYANHLDAAERTRVLAAFATAVSSPVYRLLPAPLAALGVPDDGQLAATVEQVLAALAPRFMRA
jgi:hypothetical protein